MTGPTGKSIVRALLDPRPSHPPVWDVLARRSNEVTELRLKIVRLQCEKDDLTADVRELFAANVDLSAQLASAIAERDDLKRQADLSARQRNTATYWVGH